MVVGASIIDKIVQYIIDPLILLIFSIGLVVFMWGMFVFMRSLNNESERANGRKHMIWGLTGMFIMVAVQGIIGLIIDTFDIGINDTVGGSGPSQVIDYFGLKK